MIPCPPNIAVRKAAMPSLAYTGEFEYERSKATTVKAGSSESTVAELEEDG